MKDQSLPDGGVFLTRAQAVDLIADGLGISKDALAADGDVAPSRAGEGDGQPLADEAAVRPMSREAFAYMLVRGLESTGDYPMVKMFIVIRDEASISPIYQGAVQRALLYRLTRLDEAGDFRPKDAIASGEAAQMLRGACAVAARNGRGGNAGPPFGGPAEG